MFHKRHSHSTRVEILGKKISTVIKSICDNNNTIEILDFGCGDMKIASVIKKILPKVTFTGCDIHELKPEKELPFKYIKYIEEKLPFNDNHFDLVIICDVLHHIPENKQNIIINECLRISKKIILKDHFENGFFSRLILIMMDIIGNWANGTRIPRRYFTRERFHKFCLQNSINYIIKLASIKLYGHLHFLIQFVSPPELHFIAILQKDQ